MKKITVLGNFSGRNAGDNAILGNLLNDISERIPDIKFLIPTFNAAFVNKHFSHYNIEALGLLPWNGAFKIFGYPTYRAMTHTDIVLITDNILFDRNYYNPLFNYLSTIAFFAPACAKKNIPIVLYNASLGPITTDRGKKAIQKVLNCCPVISLRDKQSKEMLERNEIKYPDILLGADSAINTKIPDNNILDKIAKEKHLFTNSNGTLSFNINAYINSWQQSMNGNINYKRSFFVKLISSALDKIIDDFKIDVILIVTQVMDLKIVSEVLSLIKNKRRVRLISNAEYSFPEITGIIGRAELHVGMRTHSLIASAVSLTPMIAINAYPKSVGFMKSIGQENWIINFDDLTPDNLSKIICRAWESRSLTKTKMEPFLKREQQKAKNTANLVKKLLN